MLAKGKMNVGILLKIFRKIGENHQISHCALHESCLKIVFRVDQRAGMHFNCILSHSVDDKKLVYQQLWNFMSES